MAFAKLNSRQQSSFEDEERMKFETEGDSIEGYYLGTESFKSKAGEQLTKHKFRTAGGDLVTCLGSFALNEGLDQVKVNTMTRVTYLGKQKTQKGRTVKKFDIEIDAENIQASA